MFKPVNDLFIRHQLDLRCSSRMRGGSVVSRGLRRSLATAYSRSVPTTLGYRIVSTSRFSTSALSARQATPLPRSVTQNELRSATDTQDEILDLPRALSPTKALILLSVPVPPVNWPSKLEMASGLLGKLGHKVKEHSIAYNMVYDGTGSDRFFDLKDEQYDARVFYPDGKVFTFERLTEATLTTGEFDKAINYISDPEESVSTTRGRLEEAGVEKLEVLVCTHGSRDCRCSDRGNPLVDSLREEIEKRVLIGSVVVKEIAHVGGHKYAANAITLPSLDMFSNLTTEHAPALISHLVPSSSRSEKRGSNVWSHWRGRYGLTEGAQAEVWAKVDPASQAGDAEVKEGGMEEANTPPTADTPTVVQLRFKTFEGEIKEVAAKVGENLLQVGKRHNLPSIEGVCGGNLECATCHVYLAPKPTPPPVPESTDEEFDMLGYAVGFRDESRLGCQIKVTPELAKWVEEGGLIGLPRF